MRRAKHFVRLLSTDGVTARVQGPPPPRWLIDLVLPFAPGEILSVLVYASRTEVTVRDGGREREIIITGPQWLEIGGPDAMVRNGYEQPIHDDWNFHDPA